MSEVKSENRVYAVFNNIFHTPLAIWAFIIFVFMTRYFPYGESTIKYTGWGGFDDYHMPMMFAVIGLFIKEKRIPNSIVLTFLHLLVFFGIIDLILGSTNLITGDFGNPYLMYSPFRPLITIVLPLFWILLIGGPSHFSEMKKRWQENQAKNIFERVFRVVWIMEFKI